MTPIRLILADDHGLLRAGLRKLVGGMEGIEVVAEAADGREAYERVQTLQPHVLATDIGMPGLNGLELTARVVKNFPDVHVLVLTMHGTEPYIRQALRFGALGYLLKD